MRRYWLLLISLTVLQGLMAMEPPAPVSFEELKESIIHYLDTGKDKERLFEGIEYWGGKGKLSADESEVKKILENRILSEMRKGPAERIKRWQEIMERAQEMYDVFMTEGEDLPNILEQIEIYKKQIEYAKSRLKDRMKRLIPLYLEKGENLEQLVEKFQLLFGTEYYGQAIGNFITAFKKSIKEAESRETLEELHGRLDRIYNQISEVIGAEEELGRMLPLSAESKQYILEFKAQEEAEFKKAEKKRLKQFQQSVYQFLVTGDEEELKNLLNVVFAHKADLGTYIQTIVKIAKEMLDPLTDDGLEAFKEYITKLHTSLENKIGGSIPAIEELINAAEEKYRAAQARQKKTDPASIGLPRMLEQLRGKLNELNRQLQR